MSEEQGKVLDLAHISAAMKELGETRREAEKPPEPVEGVPPHFHEVVQVHGRAIFDLVYASGVSNHAMGLLMQAAGRERELQLALQTVAQMYNGLAQALIAARGWTPEQIGACDAAIKASVDSRIVVPRGREIVLDS